MNGVQSRPDYYQILGIAPTAGAEEIKRAYRRAAKAWHPDRFPGAADKAKGTARFQLLNEAHRVLSDPERRRVYDAARRARQRRPAPIRPVVIRVDMGVPPLLAWFMRLLDSWFGPPEPIRRPPPGWRATR